jgi:hypothetical protein
MSVTVTSAARPQSVITATTVDRIRTPKPIRGLSVPMKNRNEILLALAEHHGIPLSRERAREVAELMAGNLRAIASAVPGDLADVDPSRFEWVLRERDK